MERCRQVNAANANGEALAAQMRALQLCCGGGVALSGSAVDGETLVDGATVVCGRCSRAVGDLQPVVRCGHCQQLSCGPCVSAAIERRKQVNSANAVGQALANDMRALQICCGGGRSLSGFAVDGASVVCGRCKGTVGDLQPVVQCGECQLLSCGSCVSIAIERGRQVNAAKAQGEQMANDMRALRICCGGGRSISATAVDAATGVAVVCGQCNRTLADLQPAVRCGECQQISCPQCVSVAVSAAMKRRTELTAAAEVAEKTAKEFRTPYCLCGCKPTQKNLFAAPEQKGVTGSAVDVAGGTTMSCSRCSNALPDMAPVVVCSDCRTTTCMTCAESLLQRARAVFKARAEGAHLLFCARHMEPCPECHQSTFALQGCAVDGTPVPCSCCGAAMPDLTGYIGCGKCKWTECPKCTAKVIGRKEQLKKAASLASDKVRVDCCEYQYRPSSSIVAQIVSTALAVLLAAS
jgi:hypothetical protein